MMICFDMVGKATVNILKSMYVSIHLSLIHI